MRPPGFRHKEVGAEEGDDPDNGEKSEPHSTRPPKGSWNSQT